MASPVVVGKVEDRPKVPKRLQVQILQRDHWLCHWCGGPVIFAPAMRYLKKFAGESALAYHHKNWRRKDAPLLDWLGAVIDHTEPHSRGGPTKLSNLVTACNKCNLLKSAMLPEEFRKLRPVRRVKDKDDEPTNWDGLSTLFVMLIERDPESGSDSELDWLQALKSNAPAAPQI